MDNLSFNTHDYDESLKLTYYELKKRDIDELIQPNKNFDETINEIYNYIRTLKFNKLNKDAIDAILLLKNDNSNNYDNLNDIHVEDLLPRVWRFVKDYDYSGKEIFIEQLSEILNNGPCPQGRTTRLFQFYIQHMDSDDKFFKMSKKI